MSAYTQEIVIDGYRFLPVITIREMGMTAVHFACVTCGASVIMLQQVGGDHFLRRHAEYHTFEKIEVRVRNSGEPSNVGTS